MNRFEEIESKVDRIRVFMAQHALSAVCFSTQANFAWITAGGDNHVGLSSEGGAATVVVTGTGRHVIASTIEAPRMREEEVVEDLGFELHVHPWHSEGPETTIERLARGGKVAADTDLPGAHNAASELARLRWQLLRPEIKRYRKVGAVCAHLLRELAYSIEPEMSELDIAGMMQSRVFAAGLLPNVCLVAADERAYAFRHPVPTSKRVRELAMLVIGARRWGLAISATRMVHFGPVRPELVRKHEAVCAVDAFLIQGSRPGAKIADLFRGACQEYARLGFPDEWKMHHQGGATGYAPREYRATPASRETVLDGQAFAWNPSIAGTKSEDTIVATAQGPEVLSFCPRWPTLLVEGPTGPIMRPDILVR